MINCKTMQNLFGSCVGTLKAENTQVVNVTVLITYTINVDS